MQHSCSLSNAICNQSFKKRIELRTHEQAVLQNTYEEPIASGTTAAATAAQTRYLSLPAVATLHGKTQGFVLRLPPHNIAHATFMQPFQCDLHSPSSPLPFVTTPLPHHFPSSPLPFVSTSLRLHFPSSPLPCFTTSLPHHFLSPPLPSSPLPFVTTPLLHHFPSSPLPFVTTPLPHHFPSSPLLCDLPPFIKVNCIASYSFVMYCYIMYCYVIYHPLSRSTALLLILLLFIVTLCIVM